jgi:hypothetical protein
MNKTKWFANCIKQNNKNLSGISFSRPEN